MSLRPHAILSTALVLFLSIPPVGIQPLAQDQQDASTPPAQEPVADATAATAGDDTPEGEERLTDRLTLRVGAGATMMRAGLRSDIKTRDGQTTESAIMVNEMDFSASTGSSLVADAWYEVGKGWFVIGRVAVAGLGTDEFNDSRGFSSRGGPGETEFVHFTGEHEADYLDWAIGGARRVFPTKRFKDSKLYLDAVLLFGGTQADYTFNNGEVTNDPFSSPAFNPSTGFDPRGKEDASLNMEYRALMAGVRFGGQIGQRASLEGHFLPVWFGSYEGTADLGNHGTTILHPPGTSHDPVGDPAGSGFGELTGNDLFAPSVDIEQDSSKASGLRVGINTYITLTDWLTLDIGYERNFVRAIGGTEDRHYSDEDLAGCPSPGLSDPTDPTSPPAPPRCPDDRGLDLLEASLVSDTIYVMGRFRLH